MPICVDCGKETLRAVHAKRCYSCQKTIRKETQNSWTQNNKDAVRRKDRKRYLAKRDELLEKGRKYRQKNKEKRMKWYAKNKEQCSLKNKEYRTKNEARIKDKKLKERIELARNYVVQLLGFSAKETSPEMVELKRLQIRLKRLSLGK